MRYPALISCQIRGDNTVSVAQGGTATHCATKQLLPQDRVSRELYIYIRGEFNKFPDVFIQAFKIVIDSWKFSMLLLYILWDDWPIFMISRTNAQLQQQLEYTLLKPDCHRWWISKTQSGREDTWEERYAIKFCFKLGKRCNRTVWNASDCISTMLHESTISFWVGQRFKEGRGSVRDDERCGRS